MTTERKDILQRELDKYGKDKAIFLYMGKPKTILVDNKMLRLNGLEKMRSVRNKINKSGKVLMRLIQAETNIRLGVKDIGICGIDY